MFGRELDVSIFQHHISELTQEFKMEEHPQENVSVSF